jgi:hypothetical protein
VTALSVETSEDAFLEVIQREIFSGFILDQGDDLPASWDKPTAIGWTRIKNPVKLPMAT